MPSKIHFHSEEINFKAPSAPSLKKWLLQLAKMENFSIKEINYIFCSDIYLLQINVEFLNHHYLTDIITFDNSETKGNIEGDIFISVDRVKENSETFKVPVDMELQRVMAHGLLHLVGYKDKSTKEQSLMREKENFYLEILHKEFLKPKK
jgi:rRNA maturation RNase YbeY